MSGSVIGVNAQIAAGRTQANAGVGFAIPSNIVRRVVPVLIETGGYQWPWLGVSGTSVGLILQQANDLPTQRGGYIHEVVSGGPADQAGLQGTSEQAQVNGLDVPVGGDVVIAINGESVIDWSDLLSRIALSDVGEEVELTILRDGEEQTITVELEARTTSG
jgi:2-alkenal reductase